MSGDYSRMRYTPRSGHIGVFEQQGRVRLDADGNELVESLDRRRRAEAIDTIGHGVVPLTTPEGFKITSPAVGQYMIGPGRAYVDGIQVDCWGKAGVEVYQPDLGELRSPDADPLDYTLQPFYYSPGFPFPTPGPAPAGNSIVYLDVWEREVTSLEDPDLIEPAIEGIDTTTRLQAAWQVKALNNLNATSNCGDKTDWDNWVKGQISTGVLTTDYAKVPSNASACIIDPSGGYTGLENRLYRVQIQTSGPVDGAGAATFVWSKDNAALGARITAIAAAGALFKLSVSTVGKDKTFSFNIDDVVEILDDFTEWSVRENKTGGIFGTVKGVDPEQLTVTVDAPLGPFTFVASQNPRIRKWEAKPQPTNNGVAIPLGTEGVTVTFGPTATDTLHAGDFWVFYARTATGKIEILTNAPPRGVLHHYMKLAVLTPGSAPQNCIVYWPPSFGGESCCTVVVNVGDDIQRAIDSLDRKIGGCVCLKAGVHVISTPIIIEERSNIVLHGESIGAVVFGTLGPATGAATLLEILNRASDITIEQITFSAVTIPGQGPPIIVVQESERVAVRHCNLTSHSDAGIEGGYPQAGFSIESSTDVEISGNEVQNCWGGLALFNAGGSVIIAENTFKGLTTNQGGKVYSIGMIGIAVRPQREGLVRIQSNFISSFDVGVAAGGGGGQVSITENAVLRDLMFGSVGIFWPGPIGTLLGEKNFGIVTNVPGATIVGNTTPLADPGHGGILVAGSDINVSENSISSSVTVLDPPSSAPVLATGRDSEALSGTYTIEVTFLTATQESNPGPASLPVLVDAGSIRISGIPTSADPNVTGRKIYGFKQGTSSNFQFIGTINDNTTDTFVVTTDQPSWGPPPPALAYDWSSLPIGIVAYQPQGGAAANCHISDNSLTGPQKGIAVLAEREDVIDAALVEKNRIAPGVTPENIDVTHPDLTIPALETSLQSLGNTFGILTINAARCTILQNVVSSTTVGIASTSLGISFKPVRSPSAFVSTAAPTPVRLQNTNIDGNNVDNSTIGILVTGIIAPTVRNNMLLDNQLGVGLYGALGALVDRNRSFGVGSVVQFLDLWSWITRFRGNDAVGGQTGLLAYFTQDLLIEENTTLSTNGTGIVAFGCEKEIRISHNVVSSCGRTAQSAIEQNLVSTVYPYSFGTNVSAGIAVVNCAGLVTISDSTVQDTAQVAKADCLDICVLNSAHTVVHGCRIVRSSLSGSPSPATSRGVFIFPNPDSFDVAGASVDVSGNHIEINSETPDDLRLVDIEVFNLNQQGFPECDLLFNGNGIISRAGTFLGDPAVVRLMSHTIAVTGNRIRSVKKSLEIDYQRGLSYVGNVVSQGVTVGPVPPFPGNEEPSPSGLFNVTA